MENTAHQTKFGKRENEQKFYALIPHDSANLDLTNECVSRFDKNLFCSKCRNLKYNLEYLPDIAISDVPEKKYQIYSIDDIFFTVISSEFLEILNYVNPDFQPFTIGKVYDKYGNLLKDYHTLKPFNYAIIRGNEKNHTSICDVCGNVYCWPMGSYLYTSPEIDNSISIWGIGLQTELIISDQLIAEIKKRHIKVGKTITIKKHIIDNPKFNLDIPLFILDKGKKVIYPAKRGL